jgi:C-terminal processing protease CtpA/Prc
MNSELMLTFDTRVGQFIGEINDDSPADAASLKEGDIIIEVNGTNIEHEMHHQVIKRIKAGGDQTTLLVRYMY